MESITLKDICEKTAYENEKWKDKDEILGQSFYEFDFTNDCSSDNYLNCNDLYKKYKAYRLTFIKKFHNRELEKMRKGYRNTYKGVIDPDSESELLQRVYKSLWDEKVICICSKNDRVYGDTMNSFQTTLNEYVWGKYEHKTGKPSTGNCVLNFETGLDEEDKKVLSFFCKSHMLGNFIPVPIGCNGPRGMGELKDYWDLTLNYIYKYYSEGKQESILEIIIGKQNVNKYRAWLDIFGDWNGFVGKNYLQPFVSLSEDEAGFGTPISLWDDHLSDGAYILPNREQALMYFENAGKGIKERSCLMAEELRKRL